MAKVFYVGDWAVMLGPVFAETPFDYTHKGTEGFVGQAVAPDHPAIVGVDLSRMPPILGYNIVKPRDGCEVVAVWKETGDPMLSVGRFGEGRVLAYTSDPAPHWGCNFVYWDQYNAFWTTALDWLMAGPTSDTPSDGSRPKFTYSSRHQQRSANDDSPGDMRCSYVLLLTESSVRGFRRSGSGAMPAGRHVP